MTLEIYRRTQIGYSHYEPRGMSYDHKWTTASFNLPPEGIAQKENKLDCFEHKHICCFKLQCAIIVYLLCTALWWQIERRGGPLL